MNVGVRQGRNEFDSGRNRIGMDDSDTDGYNYGLYGHYGHELTMREQHAGMGRVKTEEQQYIYSSFTTD